MMNLGAFFVLHDLSTLLTDKSICLVSFRTVTWGSPMSDNGLSYLKAIGIRIHTVRYQKIRRRIVEKDESDDGGEVDQVTSREYKRRRAAEERRKNPPRKVVNVLYNKEKRQYVTTSMKPKLLTDQVGTHPLSQDHYAVCFEETIVLESSNLQLSDEVVIQFRNSKMIKSPKSSSISGGLCRLTVGDMYSSILHFHGEQLKDLETNLNNEISTETITAAGHEPRSQTASTNATHRKTIIIPPPQEYALFRPAKKAKAVTVSLESLNEEMESIREAEEEALKALDSDSVQSDSDSSFLFGGIGKKIKEEAGSKIVKSNERLFGSVALSFFPVL